MKINNIEFNIEVDYRLKELESKVIDQEKKINSLFASLVLSVVSLGASIVLITLTL